MFQSIDLKIIDNIALITLNQPKNMNAMGSIVINDINQALDQLEKDESVRSLIVWGGETLFGAGANVAEMNEIANSYQAYSFARKAQALFNRLENIPMATIAAIAGYALGGCLELALACDIRLANENAQLGLPEIKLSLLPGGGGTQRLTRLIGPAQAKEIIFTGKMISAAEAHRLGIVNRLVGEGKLLEEAMNLAGELAARAPIALALIKSAINVGASMELGSALEHEAKCFAVLFDSEDRKEGVKAFLEKRKAVFKGR